MFSDPILLQSAAARHGVPPLIVAAIVDIESAGNPWAFRFEPGFLARYVEGNPQRFGIAISIQSERIGRATSWGLMQVMGQVARERGFEGEFLPELCDPRSGLEFGCRQLAHLRERFLEEHGWDGVIAAYNAGSPRLNNQGEYVNDEYVRKVNARMQGGA